MTRDAKVGLLLGLVFIFIIAFIINGLPGLRGGDGNELTRNMARPAKQDTGIGTAARQVTRDTITPIRPVQNPTVSPAVEPTSPNPFPTIKIQPQVRYTADLPTTSSTTAVETVSIAPVKEETVSAVERVLAQSGTEPAPTVQPKSISRPRIYTVKEGDSLASIAKKFYGDELGNKQATIDMIYKANRKILSSPDNIYVSQKLILPALADATKPGNVLTGENFKTVESIGARKETTPSAKYYTVKEGDSLWKIAEANLGNGSRYTEIGKLNKDLLKDEDFLVVGMRLKLPAK
ncbi:MAG: LysM peptidoglycan-binding domain-containing protein [Sedimentisphaerales bacterium]|nr:LysM peptidoglycan-binding domain-containing protein [Sedimentisphaerales bacterium]